MMRMKVEEKRKKEGYKKINEYIKIKKKNKIYIL